MSGGPRIAIVGAGIAGLAAANKLCEGFGPKGLQLIILEGSNRAGGRACSAEFFGTKIEKGATWIHGIQGSPIYAIAKQIRAMDPQERPWEAMDSYAKNSSFVAQGGFSVPDSLTELVQKCYSHWIRQAKEQSLAKFHDSLGEFLKKGLDDFLNSNSNYDSSVSVCKTLEWDSSKLIRSVFQSLMFREQGISGAEDLDYIDLGFFHEYWELPGKHMPIPKGYSAVVQELVDRLPEGCIRYNSKVESIVWGSEDGVILQGSDFKVEVDHVILTVSLGVLKAATHYPRNDAVGLEKHDKVLQEFRPALPSRKVDAIRRLGFGVVDKLWLHLNSRVSNVPNLKFVFHDSDSSLVPWWIKRTFGLFPIYSSSQIVSAWFVGKEAIALETITDEEIIQGVLGTLSEFGFQRANCSYEEINSNDGPVIDGILRSQWGTDPLFWGSYSYVARGSSGDDIDTLAEPLPSPNDGTALPLQILFAGEATDRHYYSTTHGAYLSGMREANRLLQHYNLA